MSAPVGSARLIRVVLAVLMAAALGAAALAVAPAHAGGSGAVHGRVLAVTGDSDAEPLAGVTVTVEQWVDDARADAWTTRTDDDGRYSVDDLPEDGTYYVRTEDAPSPYADEYAGNGWTRDDATALEVRGGPAVAVDDIVLEAPGHLHGVVEDASGAPVQGATVRIGSTRVVTTDASGRYDTEQSATARDVVAGEYEVSVDVHDDADTNHGWPYYAVSKEIEVRPGAATAYDVTLAERPTVDFTVVDVRDDPLARAEVALRPYEDGAWGPVTYEATDSEGRFRITDDAAKYKLCFSDPSSTNVPTCFGGAATFDDATVVDMAGRVDHRRAVVQLASSAVLPLETVKIAGPRRTGATLRAVSRWYPGGVALRYQWLAGGRVMPGATGPTVRVGSGHAGTAYAVRVTGTKPGYTTRTVTSHATARVIGHLTARTVRVTGPPRRGRTLTARTTPWGPRPVSLHYRWYRNGSKIAGATDRTYQLTRRDVGKRIRVTVTGTRPSYATATRTSRPTRVRR